MIERVEISPNSRASCKYCNEKIKKGTPRGVEQVDDSKYGLYNKYYCHRCIKNIIRISENALEFKKRQLNDVKKEFEKLLEDCKKTLIVEELED